MTALLPGPASVSVSRFEAALLRLLRALLRSPSDAPPLPAGKLAMPRGLSPACLDLVADSLSKGCVEYLARAGGWRREKHLVKGQPTMGRLWERTQVGELRFSFSSQAVWFLMWLTAGRPEHTWYPPEAELTPADKFLFFLTYDSLRMTEARETFRAHPEFTGHGLIRLFFPEDFAGIGEKVNLDFATWTSGLGASILEALQPRLQERWLELERGKILIADWVRLRDLGVSQEQTLWAFLQATQAANRPDLARFLLRAMAELLTPDLTPAFWIGGLQGAGPPRLAERLNTQRQALAVLRQVLSLGEWTTTARNTGYLDEPYVRAQLWLADWEQYRGDELVCIAQELLRQLEPLKLQPAGAPSGSTLPQPQKEST